MRVNLVSFYCDVRLDACVLLDEDFCKKLAHRSFAKALPAIEGQDALYPAIRACLAGIFTSSKVNGIMRIM